MQFYSFLDPHDWDLVTKSGYTWTEQEFGSFFYKVYDPMNWSHARQRCLTDGTKMAVPKSDSENEFISNLLPGKDCCLLKLSRDHSVFLKFKLFTEQLYRIFGLEFMTLQMKAYSLTLMEIQLLSSYGIEVNQTI